MGTIYDRATNPVDWFEDDVVYAPDGTIEAWVQDGAVFTPEGRYAGLLDSGLFRDPGGRVVAFLMGASNPILPVAEELPVLNPPPMPLERPHPPRLPPLPEPAPPEEEWSLLDWRAFIAAQPARHSAGAEGRSNRS